MQSEVVCFGMPVGVVISYAIHKRVLYNQPYMPWLVSNCIWRGLYRTAFSAFVLINNGNLDSSGLVHVYRISALILVYWPECWDIFVGQSTN